MKKVTATRSKLRQDYSFVTLRDENNKRYRAEIVDYNAPEGIFFMLDIDGDKADIYNENADTLIYKGVGITEIGDSDRT